MIEQTEILYIGIVATLGLISLLLLIVVKRSERRKKIKKTLRKQLLKVRFLQPQKEEQFSEEINKFEQLLTTLTASGEIVFEIAVENKKDSIEFFIGVDAERVDAVTKHVYALFPNCEITPSKDYTIFSSTNTTKAGIISLAKPYFLPIRTYTEANVDTFSTILSTFSKTAQVNEGVALQFIITKTSSAPRKVITSTLSRLQKGQSVKSIIFERKHPLLSVFKSMPKQIKNDTDKENEVKEVDQQVVEVVQTKSKKQLFQVNMRLVVSAPTKDQVDAIFSTATLALEIFNNPIGNSFKVQEKKTGKRFLYDFIFRNAYTPTAMVLNAEEIASVLHFPTTQSMVQGLDWMRTKQQEVRSAKGVQAHDTATPIPQKQDLPNNLFKKGFLHVGDGVYRNEQVPFYLSENDRRRHLYMIGQTGTGKSAIMKYLAYQDIMHGNGVCVLDPNGDLIEDLLQVIPPHRYDDVIVFDPSDLKKPLGINMLDHNPEKPEEKTFIVNEIQAIFDRLFDKESMGPVFQQYMRNALLLLMENYAADPATLIDVPRILVNEQYREQKLSQSNNSIVNDFWKKEASAVEGEMAMSNIAPYITSKFNGFIANDYIRPIIGQRKSSFNFREVMDSKKIIFAKLSKGRLGEINSKLLGMMIIGKLMLAAFSRDDIPQEERTDFYCYMDEFQNFSTDTIATILSEARKYRLNLTIANQTLGQLTDDIKNAVLGNVGTVAAFRIGIDDAEIMSRQFNSAYEPNELTNTPNLTGVIRMLENGHPIPPFSYKIHFSPQGDAQTSTTVKQVSQAKYGTPLAEIEDYVTDRLKN